LLEHGRGEKKGGGPGKGRCREKERRGKKETPWGAYLKKEGDAGKTHREEPQQKKIKVARNPLMGGVVAKGKKRNIRISRNQVRKKRK